MAAATTLDDVVQAPSQIIDDLSSTLDTLIGRLKEYATAFFHSVKTTFHYSILLGAGFVSYTFSGLAGPVTASAMMFGKVLVDLKAGVKTHWNELYKEGFKGILLGNLAKVFYQYVIHEIPNHTFFGTVARTVAYNPGFIGGVYNPVYLKTTEFLEDKVPQKGEWEKLTKKIFFYNSPFHYLTTNYIQNVQHQVATSAFLGTLYRVLVG